MGHRDRLPPLFNGGAVARRFSRSGAQSILPQGIEIVHQFFPFSYPQLFR